ncbi:MAG: hypothetical protein KIT14_04315 [bacterium]|nr:hypothetical protein [bacterium]
MRIGALRALVLSIVVVCVAFADPARAQCGGQQLCAANANPCVVSGSCALTSGARFDLGGRDLTFSAGARVTIPGTTPVGIAITNVHDVVFQNDARITAAEFDDSSPGFAYRRGQEIDVTASGRIDMHPAARIEAPGSHEGGDIELRAGTYIALGIINVRASNGLGFGGQVSALAETGSLTVAGGIDARGGNQVNDSGEGSGGGVAFLAAGGVTVAAAVQATGGDCSFCSVSLIGESGNVALAAPGGRLEVNATGTYGAGGEIELRSGGSTTLAGPIFGAGRGSASQEEGGSGALVTIDAGGDVTITAPVDLVAHQSSNIPDGTGGELAIAASGQVRIGAAVSLQGPGPFSQGGRLGVDAGSLLEVSAVVDASSTAYGGTIDLDATGTIDVMPAGKLRVAGGTTSAGGAGALDLQACIVRMRGTSVAVRSEATNGGFATDPEQPFGNNVLRVGQSCEIGGRLLAPTGENRVLRRDGVPGCQVNGATFEINPPLTYVDDDLPELPCCGAACQATTTTLPPGTTTTTTAPPPTTTSTTAPPITTTTTTLSQTTTTSTTVPQGSTTTTTAPPGGTTTTTTEPPAATTTTTTLGGEPTTTTTPATTTTTTAPPASTTTTLPPDPCDAPVTNQEAARCGLVALDEVLATHPADELGGVRLVTRLGKLLDRADSALGQATTAKKPKPKLRRARSQLRAFERAVRKAARKGKVRADLAEVLQALTLRVGGALDGLRSSS